MRTLSLLSIAVGILLLVGGCSSCASQVACSANGDCGDGQVCAASAEGSFCVPEGSEGEGEGEGEPIVGALQVSISDPLDDGYRDPYNGNQTLALFDWVSLGSVDHIGALRFSLAGLEPGDVIREARLQVRVDSRGEDNADLTIALDDDPDPLPLTHLGGADDLGARAATVAGAVSWLALDLLGGPPEADGDVVSSPDLASLVQLAIDHPSWPTGGHLLLLLRPNTDAVFEFRPFDFGDPNGTFAPTLLITYARP